MLTPRIGVDGQKEDNILFYSPYTLAADDTDALFATAVLTSKTGVDSGCQ